MIHYVKSGTNTVGFKDNIPCMASWLEHDIHTTKISGFIATGVSHAKNACTYGTKTLKITRPNQIEYAFDYLHPALLSSHELLKDIFFVHHTTLPCLCIPI